MGDRTLGAEPMRVAALGPRGAGGLPKRRGRHRPSICRAMPGAGRNSHIALPTRDGERRGAWNRLAPFARCVMPPWG